MVSIPFTPLPPVEETIVRCSEWPSSYRDSPFFPFFLCPPRFTLWEFRSFMASSDGKTRSWYQRPRAFEHCCSHL